VQRTFAAGGAFGSGADLPRRPSFGCSWRSLARPSPISRVRGHSRRHRPIRVRLPNGNVMRQYRRSMGGCLPSPVSSRSRISNQVTRCLDAPASDDLAYRGTVPGNVVQRTFAAGGAFGSGADPPHRPLWVRLVEPRSVKTDLSRPWSFSQAPPYSGPIAKRQLPAPSIGLRRYRRVRPARTELPLHEAG
jgi:hypothetical protein